MCQTAPVSKRLDITYGNRSPKESQRPEGGTDSYEQI